MTSNGTLDEVREQIESMYRERGDDYATTPRYAALLREESRLIGLVKSC
jgi:hypothetical protein